MVFTDVKVVGVLKEVENWPVVSREWDSFSSGNSRILIPFQGSVSVPIGTSGDPEGPADKIKRKTL